MAMLRFTRQLLALCPALLLLCPSFGAKIDLDRMQPVPADQPITIGDFFRPSVFDSPSINPAGTLIAGRLTTGNERETLIVYNLATRKTDVISGQGDRDVGNIHWLDDTHVSYTLYGEKYWRLGLFAAEVGKDLRPYPLLQYCGSRIIGINSADRLRPLVWNQHDMETEQDDGVAQVNAGIKYGEFLDLVLGGANMGAMAERWLTVREYNYRHTVTTFPKVEGGIVTSYFCDKDGALAFAVTSHEGVLTLHRFENGKWLKCPVDLDMYSVFDAGNRPGEIVVQAAAHDGHPAPVQFMNAVTGELGAVLLQDSMYEFDGWFYRDHKTHEIIGANYVRAGPAIKWFRDEEAEIQKVLNSSFEPGQVIQIISRSEVGHKYVVMRSSDRQPAIYDWVDLDAHTAGPIKSSRPWIDPNRMQRMQVMQFKTRDGHMLDAYLTLPAGTSKQHPAPMVVLPHGGPYVRDEWGFDSEAQFLANRGYAVLQPNYRGSTGYDCLFPESDKWDFDKMHDDVTDATKAALSTKLIDRDRVAIVGGSFGGYQAIAGVTGEPDLYRCAVTLAGVFDWAAVVADAKYYQYESGEYGWFQRHFGDPKQQKDKFNAISPLTRVNRIRVPVFVAHSTDDPVVDIDQSRALIAALEKNNVPFEKLIVGREGHGMQHVEKRVELYERIEQFLAKNMTPRSATAAAAAP